MDFVKTPTPPYKNQRANGGHVRESGWLDWFAGLLRTPTPQYKTIPPGKPESAQHDRGD